MTRGTRAADVRLLRAVGHPVRPANVTFELADRRWRIIWAVPDNQEQGVFFFRKAGSSSFRLVDVWGGISDGLEREELAAWARQLEGGGPPEALTQCFASALASEQ